MSKTILIADDEPEIIELLKLFLERESYRIIEAYDGEQAWNYIRQHPIDLAIIDIMMPALDGFQLIKRLRNEYKLPVIILSAKNRDSDKILGLGLGADDFISKPFNPLEAVARIQAQLRRAFEFNEPEEKMISAQSTTVGRLTLDHTACVVYRGDETITLTPLEYRLLNTFMQAPGRIFTKQQLFEQAWSETYWEDDNTIMVQISRLRDKIEDRPRQPVYIKTVRGLGYKFASKDDFDGKKT
ncbi:response regulator transcription factor [Aneurinibacillus aneurinilyticus]|uniref:Response regulator receiver domain protein n=1 Tax=Aneurinibacillus aneurinilyticus ATCC 12856 TaxID=649747 RepID=U1X4I2_ANEAE|nr:response regulator transcription factor [Aneurinibacillus aneurinilyticus]ERI09448.1 response regulator receiver domain protein [Aneurinibacillus aneurinilyticus ATCC 12856]MED0709368.1 response regulator transcription factor [Aneurinibacillus aneurinilyticus]MED0723284.1 response regulator transcription factor [Aneurinibacillus aneurinilyticus]MED0735271.1 response regulator transcription factor [Aneurinibacillus aneurinilyticus]MED0743634.1 response regulator transcription factor [Aneurin